MSGRALGPCSTSTPPSWRALGSPASARGEAAHANEGMGYAVVHVAIDDHSRYAYVELHADQRGETCARFAERALAHFAAIGMGEVEALMSDRAMNYRRSAAFQAVGSAVSHSRWWHRSSGTCNMPRSAP